MEAKLLAEYKDESVRIYLKDNLVFTGKIVEILSESIKFVDKYGEAIAISNDTIARVQRWRGK